MTQPARVLVVEDQYFVAMDCELNLRAAGHECVGLAKTGDEAVQLASELRPDLILMDIRLANGSDGVEAAIRIYESLAIRCLFASGHADAVVHQQAERANALGWLNKPYTSAVMLTAVATAMEEVIARRRSSSAPAEVEDIPALVEMPAIAAIAAV